jgi:hypothetical protein
VTLTATSPTSVNAGNVGCRNIRFLQRIPRPVFHGNKMIAGAGGDRTVPCVRAKGAWRGQAASRHQV